MSKRLNKQKAKTNAVFDDDENDDYYEEKPRKNQKSKSKVKSKQRTGRDFLDDIASEDDVSDDGKNHPVGKEEQYYRPEDLKRRHQNIDLDKMQDNILKQ